jgi:hypothetical protein
MRLTDDHVQRIRKLIDNSGITIQSLKDDLLDHLVCVVEAESITGKSFETALKEAVDDLAPGGLYQIQRETIFLLNPLKLILMKKIMYSIGLIGAAAISLGWLFKILHWPGGDELFNYGFFAFLLLFIPMLAIDRYKVNLRKALSEKLRIILGFSSAFLVGLALAFKFMNVTGADYILVAGFLIFTFGFLPFLFFTLYRKSISRADDNH